MKVLFAQKTRLSTDGYEDLNKICCFLPGTGNYSPHLDLRISRGSPRGPELASSVPAEARVSSDQPSLGYTSVMKIRMTAPARILKPQKAIRR